MALVSEDIITEILLRLPTKSVLRFKIVSKQWLSIASTPRFRQTHASKFTTCKVEGLIIKKQTPSKNSLPLHGFLPLTTKINPTILRTISNRNIHLSSSSGGLLLFRLISCRSFHLQLGDVPEYFVCNPTTNEYKQIDLASAPRPVTDSISVSSYLAFDPRKSLHYKIVFLYQLNEELSEIIVYSSQTERFGTPKELNLNYTKLCIHGGYYCNDAIHWISDHNCLYYFDLNKEEMKVCRPLPFAFNNCKYFGECLGHLFLAFDDRGECLVYELKSDYSGWFLKNQIRHVIWNQARYMFWNRPIKILGIIVDKEDDENMTIVIQVLVHFKAYNFKNKEFVTLTNPGIFDSPYSSDELYSWPFIVSTLVCV